MKVCTEAPEPVPFHLDDLFGSALAFRNLVSHFIKRPEYCKVQVAMFRYRWDHLFRQVVIVHRSVQVFDGLPLPEIDDVSVCSGKIQREVCGFHGLIYVRVLGGDVLEGFGPDAGELVTIDEEFYFFRIIPS